MKTYESKDELKAEIQKSLDSYLAEFDVIPESCKNTRVPDTDRTPAENLAYQVGWTTLLLQWEADEQHGRAAKTPHEMFKWNQLGDLYAWFTATYAPLSLAELKTMLRKTLTKSMP